MRGEKDIFSELEALCTSEGFIHALAVLCLLSSVVTLGDTVVPEDLLPMYSWERLTRVELATMQGLMVKRPLQLERPSSQELLRQVNEAHRLMDELHQAISSQSFSSVLSSDPTKRNVNPFCEGPALREPILYSGESAYAFQLREIALNKYVSDNDWLKANRGFEIVEARDVIRSACKLQNDKLTSSILPHLGTALSSLPILDALSLTSQEIARASGVALSITGLVLRSFTLACHERNEQFQSIDDFNWVSATPLIDLGSDRFALFTQHGLTQALFDSPFYWMISDNGYKDEALTNRGEFAERCVQGSFERVFGHDRVFRAVRLIGQDRMPITDIDVLVLYGDCAVIAQVKSKKLTMEARKGNTARIVGDFSKAIQDAYDQCYLSAKALYTPAIRVQRADGETIRLGNIDRIFPMVVLAEQYPALAFQVRQFLNLTMQEDFGFPIVTDIFALDCMTEMLDSPLWLVDYFRRRSAYFEKLATPDELTALSLHLRQSLWFDRKWDRVALTDDISCDLDAAMMVRREGVPGARTPDGILTRLVGTTVFSILKQIEAKPGGDSLDFAFAILDCDENTIRRFSDAIDGACQRWKDDRQSHDVSLPMDGRPARGLTVHCDTLPDRSSHDALRRHCENRKYLHHAATWLGIVLDPAIRKIRSTVRLDYPWTYDSNIERRQKMNQVKETVGKMPGRNEFCPCGSGKKFKRCCLSRLP